MGNLMSFVYFLKEPDHKNDDMPTDCYFAIVRQTENGEMKLLDFCCSLQNSEKRAEELSKDTSDYGTVYYIYCLRYEEICNLSPEMDFVASSHPVRKFEQKI